MAQRGRFKKISEKAASPETYLEKVSKEVSSNQSKLSLILGALIILVIGILVFNYFNRNKPSLGPSQQTEQTQQEDISADKLPDKYTVKEGDALFTIAEKYYQDGSKFDMIAKTNNLSDANSITAGQVLEIPKLEEVSPSPTPNDVNALGTGGGNATMWGPKIDGTKYTVQEGDWLSTISARAYEDIFAYKKIAEANNIPNPDYITPGMVLTIPR